MKFRLPGRRRAAEAGRAKDGSSAPEPAPVTWARAQLREQIQRAGSALAPTTVAAVLAAASTAAVLTYRVRRRDVRAIAAARDHDHGHHTK